MRNRTYKWLHVPIGTTGESKFAELFLSDSQAIRLVNEWSKAARYLDLLDLRRVICTGVFWTPALWHRLHQHAGDVVVAAGLLCSFDKAGAAIL